MSAADEEVQVPSPLQPFSLELHAWMETQQTAHGVRHNDDYAQYHKYCTRRLARLSHHADAKQYLVCSSKFATKEKKSSANGNNNKSGRHAYCSRQADTFASATAATSEEEKDSNDNDNENVKEANGAVVPHVHILWYLLVLSERSWSHANQLQKSKTARRQQVLAKLKKAQHWATKLLEMASSSSREQEDKQVVVTPTTLQEIQAYASWMTANYALEKLDYETASQEYAKAMTLCHSLSQSSVVENSKSTSTSKDGDKDNENAAAQQLERQDLFLTRADTVLRPLFRYCQYELKQAGQGIMEEPRLAKIGNDKKQQQQQDDEDTATDHTFRGQELVLESKELRVLLLKLQALEQQEASFQADQEEQKEDRQHQQQPQEETFFLTALSILDDALQVVLASLQTLESVAQAGPAVQAKRTQYRLWKGYLQSQKTVRVMEHTEALLKTISGHAERVHVYDALLQHGQSLLELPRPQDDDEDDARGDEEEDEFALQVQANRLRLRALKCYHMAWYYYQHSRNKNPQALALLEQAAALSKRAQEEIAACEEDMPHADEYLEELENLPLKSTKGAIRAAMYLQDGIININAAGGGSKKNSSNSKSSSLGMTAAMATKRPLLLRLNDADAGMVMAGDILPIPIPCKPVFYDLAYDYATDESEPMGTLQAYVNEHTIQPEPVEEEETKTSSSSGGLLGWLTG